MSKHPNDGMLAVDDGVDPIGDYIASLARSAAGDPRDREAAQREGEIDRTIAPLPLGQRYSAGARKWNAVAQHITGGNSCRSRSLSSNN